MGFLKLHTLRSLTPSEKIKYFTVNFNGTTMSDGETKILGTLVESLQNEISYIHCSLDKLQVVINRKDCEIGKPS